MFLDFWIGVILTFAFFWLLWLFTKTVQTLHRKSLNLYVDETIVWMFIVVCLFATVLLLTFLGSGFRTCILGV